jgi:hypothetical protein
VLFPLTAYRLPLTDQRSPQPEIER